MVLHVSVYYMHAPVLRLAIKQAHVNQHADDVAIGAFVAEEELQIHQELCCALKFVDEAFARLYQVDERLVRVVPKAFDYLLGSLVPGIFDLVTSVQHECN